LARRLGASQEQVDAVATGELGAFEPAWRAAIAYAEQMTPTRPTVDPASYTALAAHWTPPQIVEITAVAALFNYFNRFALALEIPVTR
jgi:alkylhydroperoxidase family enzyme